MTKSCDILLGIDIGTQSTKCVVLDAGGKLLGIGQYAYEVHNPRPQWFEQHLADWWNAVIHAVRAALVQANVPTSRIRGIGVTGQMHGVVLVDADFSPLRPAIIWMDRRSADLCTTITDRTPSDILLNTAANQLAPGFAGASLAWLNTHEPQIMQQAHRAIQPKDYILLKLTGTLSSEPSDASATWLFDVPHRHWSTQLTAQCGVSQHLLPKLNPSTAIIGTLSSTAANALNLSVDIPVIAGAGDQAALLMGVGVTEPQQGAITIGTGGQITVVSEHPLIDPDLRLNTFCHALPERWYTMGALLNGGIALRWWRTVITGSTGHSVPDYNELLAAAANVPAGSDGLIFIPYLEGERTPHMDANATGAFIGLRTQHTQAHMTRAVLEGVAFAFRDCLDVLHTLGSMPGQFVIGGGGAQGSLWRAIMASVLNVTLQTVSGREHTARGVALLAGVGTGLFTNPTDATTKTITYDTLDVPNPADTALYDEQFKRFQALYPALRSVR